VLDEYAIYQAEEKIYKTMAEQLTIYQQQQ
jgi:hypothetical protein